jgi:hypothetical protein
MPQLTLPIVAGDLGLTALVNVGTQKARDMLASGQSLPSGVWVTAAIDTGATLTCVSSVVLHQLGLTPTGQGSSQTARGPMLADVYRVSLSLLESKSSSGPMLTFADMNVLELMTSVGAFDVFIGMDVILTCKLLIDGPGRQFTLDF